MPTINNLSKVTKVIAFGNSYSDNGEARKISSSILEDKNSPSEAFIKPTEGLYWNNRYSNGYTSVEILAKKLNAKLINYATGGATSGHKNYTDWMDYLGNSGLLGQIDKFKNSLHVSKIDTDSLYFIFASENDYFAHMDFERTESIEELAFNVIENVKKAIKKLVSLGAKKFFVVNCSDLSLVPYEVTMGRVESAKKFTATLNSALPDAITSLKKDLGISINLFDHTIVSNDIVKNVEKYGFTELSKEYQSTYPKVKTAVGNPDSYYFWDEWHFSSTTHNIFGNEMYNKFLSNK